MVSPVDLVSAPSSDNPYVHALTGTYAYRPGYQIVYALQGNPGDLAALGGALWAAKGAAQAFVLAAQAWAAVANISIVPAGTGYDGSGSRSAYTWVEKLTGDLPDGVLGQHSLPGPGNMGGEFSNTISVFTEINNAVGGYSFLTFLHEIGHGLGLTHPHEDGNSFPGVSSDDDTGDNDLNQSIYTVMSYNDGMEGNSPSDAYGWSKTPMAFDIATIQALYGANMSTHAGNNVYLLPGANISGTGWECIWDAGGIDTISADSLRTNATIDLRAATLLDAPGGGGWLSQASGAYGGFTIAHNVVIENATGGVGDDIINGNDVNNVLLGQDGNDTIHGFGGDDFIDGGAGASTLFGEDGNDRLYADQESGASTLNGGDGDDWLAGGAYDDALNGGAGADLLIGGGGNDRYTVDSAGDVIFENAGDGIDFVEAMTSYYLYANIEKLELATDSAAVFGVGNDLDNYIRGNQADNLLLGGAGDDELHGDTGNDTLYGQDGNDSLEGAGGTDYLIGGAGNDVLSGEEDEDALYGEDGNDTLWGGLDFKTDILVGGAGDDMLHGDSTRGDYDLMDGGAGNDSYYVDTTADLTFEAVDGGTDTVFAAVSGNGYYLYANVENLTLVGDTAFGVGNELDNRMTGSELTNWLLGGAGNDTLNGKAGNDVLFGEAGADTFVFEHGTGGDTIGDFTAGTDRIDLSAFGFTSFAQVQAAMSETGGNTAIILGADYVVLNGVANAALHAGDFILSGGSAADLHAEQHTAPADEADSASARSGLIHQFDVPHLAVGGWAAELLS